MTVWNNTETEGPGPYLEPMAPSLETGLSCLFLSRRQFPFPLEAALDPTFWTRFCPIFNISFLGKVAEKMVVQQLQRILEEADLYSGQGIRKAEVVFFWRERNGVLNLLAAVDAINHGIFLIGSRGWK